MYGPCPVITAAPALRAEAHRRGHVVAAREPDEQRRRERVARSVGVGDLAGQIGGGESLAVHRAALARRR